MAGKITALRFQQRNSERVNVYLDGAFAFGIPAVEAARLRPGQYLDDDEIARLRVADAAARAYERAVRFLGYRPRSCQETERYLLDKGVPAETVERVLTKLEGAGYLDDLAFARFWVENRTQFSPRSPRALRYELRQKGLADSIIAEVLEDIDIEASAQQAAASRARRWAHLPEHEFRRKLGAFLARRGFDYEITRHVVEQFWQEQHSGSSTECG